MNRSRGLNQRTRVFFSGLRESWPLVVAVLARLILDIILWWSGYRLGDDPDTYFRIGLSWRWANDPYFIPGHWTPFQFWLNGATYALLSPVLSRASLAIPVIWNHLFFIGSLTITWLVVRGFRQPFGTFAALSLVAVLATDVAVTFSALAEPIVIFAGLLASYSWWMIRRGHSKPNGKYYLLVGVGAFIASAAHYAGWFVSAFAVVVLFWQLMRSFSRSKVLSNPNLPYIIIALGLSITFPLAWSIANYFEYGNPLRFLPKAQSYHDWFSTQPISARLGTTFEQLLAAEPLVAILCLIAASWVILRRESTTPYLLSGGFYIAGLLISSVFSWGVPSLHPRYVLFLYWLAIPAVGALIGILFRQAGALGRAAIVALLIGLYSHGIANALSFSNWIDQPTLDLIGFLYDRGDHAETPFTALVEHEQCLFPIAGIAEVLHPPDQVVVGNLQDPGARALFHREELKGYQTIVLTNPLTISRLSSDLHLVAEIGLYAVYEPGEPGINPSRPIDHFGEWTIMSNTLAYSDTREEEVHFTIRNQLSNGAQVAGITRSLELEPDSCQILEFNITDRFYSDEYPWWMIQQLVVNDVVIWSHDMSTGQICGMQAVSEYLLLTSNHVDIEIRTRVAPGRDAPIDIQYSALTTISDLVLRDCP